MSKFKQNYGEHQRPPLRKVMEQLISFAVNEMVELYPEKSIVERMKLSHEEPWWTAATECRPLTIEEQKTVRQQNLD